MDRTIGEEYGVNVMVSVFATTDNIEAQIDLDIGISYHITNIAIFPYSILTSVKGPFRVSGKTVSLYLMIGDGPERAMANP